MTPRSLFAIIIKIIGIYLVIGAFVSIPQIITAVYSFGTQLGNNDSTSVFMLGLFLIVTVAIYILIMRYCLFKTDWLIDKLHLDRGFDEEKLEISVHRSTVLKIAVIVIGAVMVIDSLPTLCKEVFVYSQMSAPDRGFNENPSSKYMIVDFVKLFIGIFLMTSSRLVVNFIERKRREPPTAGEINLVQKKG